MRNLINKLNNLLYTLLLLALCACSNDSDSLPANEALKASDNHFYGMAYPEQVTRGVAQRDNLWYPGSTIKVKFLNDPYNMADKVKTYAAEWGQYADIHFQFIESGDAHVRIGFDWNDERYITWSYIGTDCKMVANQSEATMSFAYWDSSTEQEIKGDVLRAFGQVLGLELEHRHLDFDAGWTSRIAGYWEGELEDVTWDNLQKYVFTPLGQNDVIQAVAYDEESIMIWPFSSRYATHTARAFNYELSETDKELIGTIYPKAEEEAIVTMTTQNAGTLRLYINNNSEVTIDWGDGSVRDTVSTSLFSISHVFETESSVVKLYGATDALTHFSLARYQPGSPTVTELDVSKNTELEELICIGFQLSLLDVSKNLKLVSLSCSTNNISVLDVSNNKELVYLFCSRNYIHELELPANGSLEALTCDGNQLTSLDVSNNLQVTSIQCGDNPFVFDSTALFQFIESLPVITNGTLGKIHINSDHAATFSIDTICAQKNWDVWYY